MSNEKIQENNGVLQVSDWSQKYKLFIYAITGVFLVGLGLQIVSLLEQIAINTAIC